MSGTLLLLFASIAISTTLFFILITYTDKYFEGKYGYYRNTEARKTIVIVVKRTIDIVLIAILITSCSVSISVFGDLLESPHRSLNNSECFLLFLLIFALGLTIYSLRCRARLLYGVIETGVGLGATYQAIQDLDNVTSIQFLVGLYVIVRGLDNIEKGLRDRQKIHDHWKRFFGPQV